MFLLTAIQNKFQTVLRRICMFKASNSSIRSYYVWATAQTEACTAGVPVTTAPWLLEKQSPRRVQWSPATSASGGTNSSGRMPQAYRCVKWLSLVIDIYVSRSNVCFDNNKLTRIPSRTIGSFLFYSIES